MAGGYGATLATILRRDRALVMVTAFQVICGLYFMVDAMSEMPDDAEHLLHPLLEFGFVAVLWIGSILGGRELWRLSRRYRAMEGRMRAASGAFLDLLEENFADWRLTPAERDVAFLALKGLSISEIAALRATRDGTVKAQCAAVYRKAGVNGRAQLLSLFVEDLMSGLSVEPVSEDAKAASGISVAMQHRSP